MSKQEKNPPAELPPDELLSLEAITEQPAPPPQPQQPEAEVENPPLEVDSWNKFMERLQTYTAGQYALTERKSMDIDIDIIATLRMIRIPDATHCDIANAILREFLMQHKDMVMPLFERPKTLY